MVSCAGGPCRVKNPAFQGSLWVILRLNFAALMNRDIFRTLLEVAAPALLIAVGIAGLGVLSFFLAMAM